MHFVSLFSGSFRKFASVEVMGLLSLLHCIGAFSLSSSDVLNVTYRHHLCFEHSSWQFERLSTLGTTKAGLLHTWLSPLLSKLIGQDRPPSARKSRKSKRTIMFCRMMCCFVEWSAMRKWTCGDAVSFGHAGKLLSQATRHSKHATLNAIVLVRRRDVQNGKLVAARRDTVPVAIIIVIIIDT